MSEPRCILYLRPTAAVGGLWVDEHVGMAECQAEFGGYPGIADSRKVPRASNSP